MMMRNRNEDIDEILPSLSKLFHPPTVPARIDGFMQRLKPITEGYVLVSRMAIGTYGKVWFSHGKPSAENPFWMGKCAVKQISFKSSSQRQFNAIVTEVEMLNSLRHENIVKLLEVCGDQKNAAEIFYPAVPRRNIYLVFEFCDHTLKGVMEKVVLTECERRSIAWQLLNAVSYMHLKEIVHRDIKPANVLITRRGKVRLSDFGLSIKTADITHTSMVGTLPYIAPELAFHHATYGCPVDMWSVGCLFYKLWTNRKLFLSSNAEQLRMEMNWKVMVPEGPRWMCGINWFQSRELDKMLREEIGNPSTVTLISGCLEVDPDKRFTAVQALGLPIFDGKYFLQDIGSSLQMYDGQYFH